MPAVNGARSLATEEKARGPRGPKRCRLALLAYVGLALYVGLFAFDVALEHGAEGPWRAIAAGTLLGRDGPQPVDALAVMRSIVLLLPMLAVLYLGQIHAAERYADPERWPLRRVLLHTTVLGLPLLILPPLMSPDVLSYIAYARMAVVYGTNPLVDVPAANPDVFVQSITSEPYAYTTSVYGPVWLALGELLARLAEALGGRYWVYVLLFKTAAWTAHLGCVAVVWLLAAPLGPRSRLVGTIALAWNPVLLLENAWSGHNDSLALLLLLLAVLAWSRHPLAATVVLALAIPTKWLPGLAVPLFAVLLVRTAPDLASRLRRLGLAALVGLAVVATSYAPYWQGPPTLTPVTNAKGNAITGRSLIHATLIPARQAEAEATGGPDPEAAQEARIAAELAAAKAEGRPFDWASARHPYAQAQEVWLRRLSAAVLLVVIAARAWCVRDLVTLVGGLGWIMLVYVEVTAAYFWPWYLELPLGLAFAAGDVRLRRAAVLLSVCTLWLYVDRVYLGRSSPWGPPIVHGIPLAYLLYLVLGWLRTRVRSGGER
jgi:hypothetical protein